MGNIFSRWIFTRYCTLGRDVRVILIGLDAAGKTTLLYKLKLGEMVQTVPTIGFNVEFVQYKKLTLTMWDIGKYILWFLFLSLHNHLFDTHRRAR